MSGGKNPIRYSEARALEDVTLWQGAVPTRIFAFLLPVWRVGIRATVTQGEDYALIDRFLERGIALAGLDTPAALADFLGLDEVVVDRALRFLEAIGHLARQEGRLTLTDLGQRSVRDDKRYIVTRQDRRVLHFDAFQSRPLTSPYYDDVGVRRRALLERVDFYLSYRASPDRVGTEALVSQLARLLDLGAVGLPELRQMAIERGKGGLAAQLASLS